MAARSVAVVRSTGRGKSNMQMRDVTLPDDAEDFAKSQNQKRQCSNAGQSERGNPERLRSGEEIGNQASKPIAQREQNEAAYGGEEDPTPGQ